jgi:hypothetical protein
MPFSARITWVFVSIVNMMNHPEIAIISAAIRAYLESEGLGLKALPEGVIPSPIDDIKLKALIAAALAAYLGTESAAPSLA